jgi:hypothetical protein
MSDEISSEDRERLVEAKFGELFDRFWEKKFGEEFDRRVTEMTKSRPRQTPSAPSSTEPAPQQEQSKPRKYSLLDKALGI